jgi:hypothetical protein
MLSRLSTDRIGGVRDAAALQCVFRIGALLGLCVVASPLAAQAPADVQGRIGAHLTTGEFAAALALADTIAAPAARNQMLARIAQAQAAGGARGAARATLNTISDDRVRSYAVDQIGQRPLDGMPARGGATQADFDTLIDLITSTIAPTTWDTVGGPGAIDGFPGGVYVDTSGLLVRVAARASASPLASIRLDALNDAGRQELFRASPLRKVSLTRLERLVQLRHMDGQAPTEAMKMLAGLHRVKYLFVYPDTGDIVIAGPAGAWTRDAEGRAVNADSGEPVLQLDDFVVLLRNAISGGGRFTCSITPRQENLAAVKAYLEKPQTTTAGGGRGGSQFSRVRDLLGKQAIEVKGIDAQTRVARVIVEADYRMKLVGMGLEEGVFGVTSYLDSIEIPEGGSAPPMSVLRWWFAMNYSAIHATPDRRAYEPSGQAVKVLSENEMLTERGERIHTGRSDELTEKFAHSFTKHFDALAAKYPVYADLRNVFDLAMIAALVVAEDLPGQTGWHAIHFGDPQRYIVAREAAPTEVETVMNQRTIRTSRKRHTIAGVSGGVFVDSSKYVKKPAIKTDDYGALEAEHHGATVPKLTPQQWWWD